MQVIDDKTLRQLFRKSADVQFQTYTFNKQKVLFVTCESMIDGQMLNEVVIQRVQSVLERRIKGSIDDHLYLPDLKRVTDKEEVISHVYTGHVLLYFEQLNLLFSSDISQKPNRTPEDTQLEVSVKGPRDNFIEDLAVNIALIRKRLPTNSLCVDKMEVGRRSKTEVAILYFDDIANPNILAEIKKQINKIEMDVIFSGEILMEQVTGDERLFPKIDETGRPDYAIQSLVRGRFLILVDGVAYGMITPVSLFLLLKAGDDSEYPVFFSSFARVLRLFGIGLGLLLPGFWLALITFHQDQLPLHLLATVVVANTGLPLPSALEMLLMILMFELFREAGVRLPSAIGGTISVVGGLIIGDAAIRAGITSPAMIIVIATSVIASFTLVNQSFMNAVSILRIIFIFLSAFLGLFGFFMSLYFTVLYLSNMRVFGVPYTPITADLSWGTIKKSIIRLSALGYKTRPNALDPIDKTRTENAEDK